MLGASYVVAAITGPTVPSDYWPPAPDCPRVAPTEGAPQPHIIMHVTDDQGWANVGYHNTGNVITPTMDLLATKEGIRFERHYAYQWCAPSRASLMTGRLPYHVYERALHGSGFQHATEATKLAPEAVNRGMTMLPKKLQSVGYITHQIGKWHLGMMMDWQTPVGRGFNSSFGYLGGGEDHNTQAGMRQEWGCSGTDLWQNHGPVSGGNGTYGGYLYNNAAVRIIEEHPQPDVNPLFMYLATQTMHAPLQVPSYFSDMYENYTHLYGVSNGMATVTDSILENVTTALKKRGMWNHTLIVHVSDNGGPVAGCAGASHANNYPLRGGKHTNWEGGIRVVAFASGGFLPKSRYGMVLNGMMHNCDWYPTLAKLAGASPDDPPAPGVTGVPGIDGYDMWPYIVGKTSVSPRSQVLISAISGTIIEGDMKLILGKQRASLWTAPVYPNASGPAQGAPFDCAKGCLFNVTSDPSEYNDLALIRPDEVERLTTLFETTVNATEYNSPPQTPQDPAACRRTVAELDGYLGPYYHFATPSPSPPPTPPSVAYALWRYPNTSLLSSSAEVVKLNAGSVECLVPSMNSRNITVVASTSGPSGCQAVWIDDVTQQGWIVAQRNSVGSGAQSRLYLKLDEHKEPGVATKTDFCLRGRLYLNPQELPSGSTHQGFTFNGKTGTIESSYCNSVQHRCLTVDCVGCIARGGSCRSKTALWRKLSSITAGTHRET